MLAQGSRSFRWITSWAEKNDIRRSSLCDSERDKIRRKVQKLVMGDSRDEDRADPRSRKIGPLSRKITTVVAKSHGSERSSCLEKSAWPPSKVRALLPAPTHCPRSSYFGGVGTPHIPRTRRLQRLEIEHRSVFTKRRTCLQLFIA